MKIPNAIILIEAAGDEILGIHAFASDETGREQARDLFYELAQEQDGYEPNTRRFTDEQIALGWREGWIGDPDDGCDAWTLSFHTAEP